MATEGEGWFFLRHCCFTWVEDVGNMVQVEPWELLVTGYLTLNYMYAFKKQNAHSWITSDVTGTLNFSSSGASFAVGRY